MIICDSRHYATVSPDWTEKYRPKTLSAVVGNPKAVADLTAWAKQWTVGTPKTRAVVLMGPPGIGKTTSAEALARDMGWDIIEMNASDQRTGDAIRDTALRGAFSNTFGEDGEFLTSKEGKRKLIVLDEADSLFGNADRGAMPAIVELIRQTKQPVMLIVNDFYELSRKSAAIKSETLQISFQRPTSVSIMKALRNICKGEGIEIDDETLKAIAENSNGDVRAAVRDLESISLGRTKVTGEDAAQLSNRIVRKSIYDLMYATFRKRDPFGARKMMMDIDEEPRTVMSWVDENLPYEYREPIDLYMGYQRLARADIFLGRVMRRQYYGFWSYAGDMMIAGVACERTSSFINRNRFNYPSYVMKLSRSKGIRATKASLCQKLADYTHNSTKRVAQDMLDPIKTCQNRILNCDLWIGKRDLADPVPETGKLAMIDLCRSFRIGFIFGKNNQRPGFIINAFRTFLQLPFHIVFKTVSAQGQIGFGRFKTIRNSKPWGFLLRLAHSLCYFFLILFFFAVIFRYFDSRITFRVFFL